MDKIIILPKDRATVINEDWGSLSWFASRALGNSSDMTVGKCVIKPGKTNPRHYHPNCSEVLVVMKGRIRHTFNSEEDVELSAGDTITIPAGILHQANNVGDEEAVLMIAYSSSEREVVGEGGESSGGSSED